jgi:hypothetical protein
MLDIIRCNSITEAPADDPFLVVTPDADSIDEAYNEGTTIQATCTVRDALPPANILWFFGELLIQSL